jgi:hypothetical protein
MTEEQTHNHKACGRCSDTSRFVDGDLSCCSTCGLTRDIVDPFEHLRQINDAPENQADHVSLWASGSVR